MTSSQAAVMRQAYAGLCWNKQYFGFDGGKWLNSGAKKLGHNFTYVMHQNYLCSNVFNGIQKQ